MTTVDHTFVPVLTLLRLYEPLANGKQVWLVVEDRVYVNHGHDDPWNKSFWFDEHTCPTNYLGQEVAAIIDGDDTDPHGIFTWVRTIERPADYDGHADWLLLFPEINGDTVIEGALARRMVGAE